MDAPRSGTPPGRWTPQLGGRRPLDGRPQFDGCRNLIDAPRSGSISPAPLSQLSSHSITGHLAARMGQASPESPKRQRISPPPMIQRPIRPSPPSHPTLARTPIPRNGNRSSGPQGQLSSRSIPQSPCCSLSHPAAEWDRPPSGGGEPTDLVGDDGPVVDSSRSRHPPPERDNLVQVAAKPAGVATADDPAVESPALPPSRPHEWDRTPLGRPDTAGFHHRRRSSGRSVPFPRHRVRRAAPAPQR